MQNIANINKAALVTGGGRRIGAQICRTLHDSGMNIVVHFNASDSDARQLVSELNDLRDNSAIALQANLTRIESLDHLVEESIRRFGRLDTLVNNAARFYPTPPGSVTADEWQDIVGTNLKAPFFLSQAAAPELAKNSGSIINIVDIYADRPLADHPVYCAAKAGLAMLTKSLAGDLAPDVRVNGVSPGAILWPETGGTESERKDLLTRIPAGRLGEPADIADTVRFLVRDAGYISGQIISVDGGRTVVA